MKFYRGQKIICISKKSDWDYLVPNFDETLKVALGVIKIPVENETYIVKKAMDLFYKGKVYIMIEGFHQNSFDENGFVPAGEDKMKEESIARQNRAFTIKN